MFRVSEIMTVKCFGIDKLSTNDQFVIGWENYLVTYVAFVSTVCLKNRIK